MSRKRLSSPRRPARSRVKKEQVEVSSWSMVDKVQSWPARALRQGLEVRRFAGLSLAGGKTDKTCLALVEYYPSQNKVFLSRLFEKIGSEGDLSADLHLHHLLTKNSEKMEFVAFDVPLQLPKCLRCTLRCPGVENCSEPEILWMWKHYKNSSKKRKHQRLFTPYTERCAELYLSTELEENFHLPHALGSNRAPLTARALFVSRRLSLPVLEVFPQLSVWRIGKSLHIGRSHLLHHKHAVGGDESRRVFLQRLVDKNLIFLYEQDKRTMVANNQAFEAFIASVTAVLFHKGQCQERPRGFPKSESWLAVPGEDLVW